ncbi:MAG: helix-turn-helix domain-containing protein [Streptosporangiaceae bacterium]|nr:helix-turn-helix domain-containing protein [Streptosporangiaceae bacterium]
MNDTGTGGYSPTIRKRTLARKLVKLRQDRKLTTTAVQRRLGWSATKLNWIEKARWIEPVTDQVTDLCELYGVEGAERDALITLARQGRDRGWWGKYSDVFSSELPGVEAGASQIRTFETGFIPGLLQVPGYIELITRAAGIDDPAEIARHTDARLRRQDILTREHRPCRLHAIIDENAVARITDPGIRRDQLGHLLKAVGRPNVDVQILPFSAGVYPAAGEVFIYLSYPGPDERDIVYLETAIDDRMLEEYDELERYRLKFDKLRAVALTPKDTRAYLKQQIG